MKILDISWPISSATTSYKDRFMVRIDEVASFEQNGVRESTLQLNAHTGTHIDAPSHFLRDGHTIDQVPLIMGHCIVLDCMQIDVVNYEHLRRFEQLLTPDTIVLLKTANSLKNPTDKFDYQFVYLDASGAEFLAAKKIKAVGIDYLGIERNQPDHITHITLMNASITIVEGLRLEHVASGNYFLICLPLALVGAEAAPARAILIEDTL